MIYWDPSLSTFSVFFGPKRYRGQSKQGYRREVVLFKLYMAHHAPNYRLEVE